MDFSDSELQDMIDHLDLDPNSAAVAVARQCLAQGYDSLTPKQKSIYEHYLLHGPARELPPEDAGPR